MIKVARIINTHGLKGECKLNLVTDDAKHRFSTGRKLYLKDGQALTVSRYREQKGFGYVYFDEITNIDQATAFKEQDLFIKVDDLPDLEDGEFYYYELMNCDVVNEKGELLGHVSDILETGANVVLRVSDDQSNFLLPFVPVFIKNVDLDNDTIYIEEMEGLR